MDVFLNFLQFLHILGWLSSYFDIIISIKIHYFCKEFLQNLSWSDSLLRIFIFCK